MASNRKEITPEMVQTMKRLQSQGKSMSEIAEFSGVSTVSVYRHLSGKGHGRKNKKVKEKEAPKHPTDNGIPKQPVSPILAKLLAGLEGLSGAKVLNVPGLGRSVLYNEKFPEEKKIEMMMELRDENHQLSSCLAGLLKSVPDDIVVSMFLDYRKTSLENDQLKHRLAAHHRADAIRERAQGKK